MDDTMTGDMQICEWYYSAMKDQLMESSRKRIELK